MFRLGVVLLREPNSVDGGGRRALCVKVACVTFGAVSASETIMSAE
jgi:hypothetical protein